MEPRNKQDPCSRMKSRPDHRTAGLGRPGRQQGSSRQRSRGKRHAGHLGNRRNPKKTTTTPTRTATKPCPTRKRSASCHETRQWKGTGSTRFSTMLAAPAAQSDLFGGPQLLTKQPKRSAPISRAILPTGRLSASACATTVVYARSWTHLPNFRRRRRPDDLALALVVEEAGHHVPRHPVRVTAGERYEDDAVDVEALAVPTAVFADEDGVARDCGCQDEMPSHRAPLEQFLWWRNFPMKWRFERHRDELGYPYLWRALQQAERLTNRRRP